MSHYNVEVAHCLRCRGEIYVGDEVWRVDDGLGYVHDACAHDYALERTFDAHGLIDNNGGVI